MGALYLIRHARPTVEGVLLGGADPPLSDSGREDARSALSGLRVEAVYSSPLRRALETAAHVGSNARVIILEELAEISMGDWDGKTWDEIERSYRELAAKKSGDWYGVTPPAGEPWQNFSSRVLRALDRVLKTSTPAAIVAHSAVNAVIASYLSGAPAEQFRQNYCEVMAFDI